MCIIAPSLIVRFAIVICMWGGAHNLPVSDRGAPSGYISLLGRNSPYCNLDQGGGMSHESFSSLGSTWEMEKGGPLDMQLAAAYISGRKRFMDCFFPIHVLLP